MESKTQAEANAQLLEELRSLGHEKRFSTGEFIIREGEKADCLYLIISGSVMVYLEDEDGEIVLAYLGAGDVVGEVPLNPANRERTASARARADTTVCRIAFDRFVNAASKDHRYWLLIIQQMGRHLGRSNERVRHLATMTAEQRILHMLGELAELPGAEHDSEGTEIRVTRQELGCIAGCTREMAGRVIKNLADNGHIEIRGHKIWVRNTEAPL